MCLARICILKYILRVYHYYRFQIKISHGLYQALRALFFVLLMSTLKGMLVTFCTWPMNQFGFLLSYREWNISKWTVCLLLSNTEDTGTFYISRRKLCAIRCSFILFFLGHTGNIQRSRMHSFLRNRSIGSSPHGSGAQIDAGRREPLGFQKAGGYHPSQPMQGRPPRDVRGPPGQCPPVSRTLSHRLHAEAAVG